MRFLLRRNWYLVVYVDDIFPYVPINLFHDRLTDIAGCSVVFQTLFSSFWITLIDCDEARLHCTFNQLFIYGA